LDVIAFFLIFLPVTTFLPSCFGLLMITAATAVPLSATISARQATTIAGLGSCGRRRLNMLRVSFWAERTSPSLS
jgi:hypothetical protein